MIPTQAFLQLEELLSAGDTGRDLDPSSCDWSDNLAAACAERLLTSTVERRKRIIRLLERMAAPDAKAVLLGYLPKAQPDDVADVLHGLCSAGIKVPADQLLRWIDQAGIPAICAAGLSGELALVPKLESLLDQPGLGWHAALALAKLGHRPSTAKIAQRIRATRGLEGVGFIVALEMMNDPAVVPLLCDYLRSLEEGPAWELGHALWRLTGREPLLPLDVEGKALGRAIAAAWRQFDLAAPARPRLASMACEPDGTATFQVLDGAGQLRLDFDPPQAGSSWPRWDVSLYLGQQRLYTVGSLCGTCETMLKLIGMPRERAATAATTMRETLATVATPRAELLLALAPLLTAMRTGHYLARVVDIDLEYVTVPERSWLTQRLVQRQKPSASFCEPPVVQWPGAPHFQALRPVLEEVPTYGVVLPTSHLGSLDGGTVARYEEELGRGARPAALLLAWLEEKNVRSSFPERFLNSVVLDGHHKLMAYHRQGIPARCLVVARLDDCDGPADDRSRWLRQSLRGFQH